MGRSAEAWQDNQDSMQEYMFYEEMSYEMATQEIAEHIRSGHITMEQFGNKLREIINGQES